MYCEIENFCKNGNFLSPTKEFWSGAQVLGIGEEAWRECCAGHLGVCEKKRRGWGENVAGHQLSIIGAQTTNNLSAARLLGRQRQQQ